MSVGAVAPIGGGGGVDGPLLAAGAPFDQGLAQGLRFRAQIERVVLERRARAGGLGWIDARRAASRGAARKMLCHVLQQHERLQGIADGARVGLAALEAFEMTSRVCGVGSLGIDGTLEARLDVHPDLGPELFLRESRPDAVGFASVELAHALWTGCLAGINARGVAVVVVDDAGTSEISLRTLAQDLLLRADGRETGLAHLALRARYAGGTGVLLVGDETGASQVRIRAGQAEVDRLPARMAGSAVLQSTVELRFAERELSWLRPDGVRQSARLGESPPGGAAPA